MNPRNLQSLERVIGRLERSQRRASRRVTPASLALVAGLFLGFLLLTQVIPQVWPVLLADDPAHVLHGWPLQLWNVSALCTQHDAALLVVLCGVSVVILSASYRIRLLRPLVWVAALGVVVVDAGILASTILACLHAAQKVV